MMRVKGITLTIEFDGWALNRDENLGGNERTIKKIKKDGQIYSFISSKSLRHHLFWTLHDRFNWPITDCVADKDTEKSDDKSVVVQPDLTKHNIITSPELDAFGYMYTIKGDMGLSRKAPVGITHAIALNPWDGTSHVMANHDFARRVPNATPIPVKEENDYNTFRASFTIDVGRLGVDEWYVNRVEYKDGELSLIKIQVIITGSEKKGNLKIEKKPIFTHTVKAEKLSDNEYKLDKGRIIIEELKPETDKDAGLVRVKFIVDEDEKKRRIYQIMTVIKNGLMYRVGTDCGIKPLRLYVAGLEVAMPVLHYGDFDSDYIVKDVGEPLVYKYDHKNIQGQEKQRWHEFLKRLGVGVWEK